MRLFERISQERRLRAQAAEISALRKQVERLEAQNQSMKDGMRRCLTCEYRLEVVGKR
jgi:cell division protein FtsB